MISAGVGATCTTAEMDSANACYHFTAQNGPRPLASHHTCIQQSEHSSGSEPSVTSAGFFPQRVHMTVPGGFGSGSTLRPKTTATHFRMKRGKPRNLDRWAKRGTCVFTNSPEVASFGGFAKHTRARSLLPWCNRKAPQTCREAAIEKDTLCLGSAETLHLVRRGVA
jgi:hypothetical protein